MWIIENKGKELAKEIEKQYSKVYEMLKEALAPLYDELLVFKEKGIGDIDSIDICYGLENNIVSIFIGNEDDKIVRLKYKLESLLRGFLRVNRLFTLLIVTLLLTSGCDWGTPNQNIDQNNNNEASDLLLGYMMGSFLSGGSSKEKVLNSIITQKSNLTKPTTNIPKPTFSTPKTSTSNI